MSLFTTPRQIATSHLVAAPRHFAIAAVLGACALGAVSAQARTDVSISIGVGLPGAAVVYPAPVHLPPRPVFLPAPPALLAPPPVFLPAPPVYVQPVPPYLPPASIYLPAPPVVLQPAPIFFRPQPVFTYPPAIGYMHRPPPRDHHRWRHPRQDGFPDFGRDHR